MDPNFSVLKISLHCLNSWGGKENQQLNSFVSVGLTK